MSIMILSESGATDVHVPRVNLPKAATDVPLAGVIPDPWLGRR
jgi:hypothetical protein